MGAFAILAILTALTIDDQKFKLATLAILALFAIRTLTWNRKLHREREEQNRDE